MKPPVKWLLLLTVCGGLAGCVPQPPGPTHIDTSNEPTQPRKSDYVTSQTASNYRYGMWLYRQSLINYIGKLSEYVNQIGLSEGYRDTRGRLCVFPYEWTPIVLPDTPAPVTSDPDTVNAILVNHVRELRKLIRDTNARYVDCVK